MSNARPLPLPPSGISVWRPLPSSEGGLVAILGSGPAEGEHASGEDVQCVWCGLRSRPAAACEVCGSPLYETIAIWHQAAPGERPVQQPSPEEPAQILEAHQPDSVFKAFRRFAGLDIRWVSRPAD